MGKDDSVLGQIERDLLEGKPLPDLLLKCVLLGGRAGSPELRVWASRELKGYDGEEDLPDYRKVGAPMMRDTFVGAGQFKGERIGVGALPEFAREHLGESVPLTKGIAELESMVAKAENGYVKLSLPGAPELARVMNSQPGRVGTKVTGLYWSVSVSALLGCVDHVRTVLAELVAELRAVMPAGQAEPNEAQAQQAVSVVLKVDARALSRVTVTQAVADTGDAVVSQSTAAPQTPPWWQFVPKAVWGFTVGVAAIAGTVIAYLAYTR